MTGWRADGVGLLLTSFLCPCWFGFSAGNICTYENISYTFVGNVTAPGNIIDHAQECHDTFNGALFEHRDTTFTAKLLISMVDQGCILHANFSYWDNIVVAPQAWSFLGQFTSSVEQNASEVARFWKYADGTSVNKSLFGGNEPNGWVDGAEVCMYVNRYWASANDFPCFVDEFGSLCQVGSPESAKSCPSLPMNPTAGDPNVAIVKPATADGSSPKVPPFPFGSVVKFVCPAGSEWNIASRIPRAVNPRDPWPGTSTSLDVKCLGTLSWTTFNAAAKCSLPTTKRAVEIESGTAQMIFEPFLGNHSKAALLCENRSLTLPRINSVEDLWRIQDLLGYHAAIEGDIPLGQNIMLDLTPSIAQNRTAYLELWTKTVTINESVWHSNEPLFTSANPAGCAVFSLRNATWKLASKKCSAISNATSYMCMNDTSGISSNVCDQDDLLLPRPGIITSPSPPPSQSDPITFGSGSQVSQRCLCGKAFRNLSGNLSITLRSTCWASLGWIPMEMKECVDAPLAADFPAVGLRYSYTAVRERYGITTAAHRCFAKFNGAIAETESAAQIKTLALILQAHCIPSAYLAPTIWRSARGSLANAHNGSSSATIRSSWLLNNGSGLPSGLPFLPGEPNGGGGGGEHCLQLLANDTEEDAYGLADVECWNGTDGARHFCAASLQGTQYAGTSCAPPRNPTEGMSVKAIIDGLTTATSGSTSPLGFLGSATPPAPQSLFAFNSTVNFRCPDGYSWSPRALWPRDPTAASSQTQSIRVNVTVTCLGTLGWTLYDVTECRNTTTCGSPPVPAENAMQTCSVNSEGSYECVHLCSNISLVWDSGADNHTLKCDDVSATWDTYNDSCVPRLCNDSSVWDFFGVSKSWNGNTSIGTNVTYSCLEDEAFDGNAAQENVTFTSTCQPNGTWSIVSNLSCSPIRCNRSAVPNFADQGVLRQWNGNRSIGSVLTFSCGRDQAFDGKPEAENETLNVTCQEDGAWSSVPNLTCSPIRCNRSALPELTGVLRGNQASVGFGTVVKYSCPQGFSFYGNSTSIDLTFQTECESNGSWSALPSDLQCRAIQCNRAEIMNLSSVLQEWNGNVSIGASVKYFCPINQAFGGENLRENTSVVVPCQPNGLWASIASNTTCAPIRCNQTAIPTFSGVLRKWDGDAAIGAEVSFYCPQDQAFDGTVRTENTSIVSICQTNGSWSRTSDLRCLPTRCNRTAIPTFSGVLNNWNGNVSVGYNFTYFCPENQALDGVMTAENKTVPLSCHANGSWSNLPPLRCAPIRCNRSAIQEFPQAVARLQDQSCKIGTNVTYRCKQDKAFEGNKTVENETAVATCQPDGYWSTFPPLSCLPIRCNKSELPDFSGVLRTSPVTLEIGSKMTYSCPPGFSYFGNSTAIDLTYSTQCQVNGTWSPIPNLQCIEITCSSNDIRTFPGVIEQRPPGNKIGSEVVYTCPSNNELRIVDASNGTSCGNSCDHQVSFSTECLENGTWSEIPSSVSLVCFALSDCDLAALTIADNDTSSYAYQGLSGPEDGLFDVGDTVYQMYMAYAVAWTCVARNQLRAERVPKWFPERIPVPTLPSYPVDFVETTLYHWGRAVENATCTGCLTGNISAPIESPGPTQFGQGVEIRGWDNECLEDNDFERRANFTCFANPMTCANGSNGISMGFFYKRGIPMKDVYLVYFNPKNSSANYPTKETLVSSGGDREGHPGIHVWWEGPFLGVLVSTGELYWEVLFLPKLFNDTWNNIGFRWFRPTPGVDDDGRLEVLINVEQQAATNQAKRASRVQSMLLPPTMLMGCHKDSTNTQKRFYGEGFFDEVAFWDTFIFDNTSRMFAGGYLPELNGVPTSVILDSIRESAKLEDERTRQVAWIAVQSIASDTNMTSEPVRPADAALNKTGETPSQQVENLVKFVTTLQSAEYISSSNSIGAVAKAARTSMSATSTLLSGNRHAWEEIADAGYKPGAYALVKSQNDYFMNMADSIAVDTKMTSAQMIDVTSDEIVSKLGVARIGHLRQSPTLKFPNYEDEIWGNGSMSKKFDYPVDTIEVPLGLYFPSSKTCDGTNLVNIEMNAYKNLDDFMPPNKVNPLKIVSQDNVIDSNILYFAFTLNKNIPKAKVAGCQPDALAMISNPIKLLFRHKMDEPAQEAGFKSRKLKFHTEEVEYNIKVRRCVWWNPSMNEFGGWDPSGCNIYDTADNFTMCECAAQGLFGILGEMIQHYELPTEPTWLTVVKFVGYGLSILCLPLFIVIVLKSKDHLHDQFHIMRANLAFALLVGLILHCISDLHSIRDSRHACTAISVMFHYFYTAAGAWFCFESYASFVAITQGIIGGKLRAYIPLCWGLPFLSVGAALIQDMLSYGTDPRCMISFDNEMKWIFFGPLLTFASIGFLLSAIVICNISTPALRKDHIADELVSVGQGLAAQVTYFLCTWIAGVCAYFIYDWTIETPGFYALFQVLNAYTGVFYLVFMGFISLRFRMVVLGVAQKRKLMILQYLTRNQHEQLKPTPSVDNQQSDELPDELFAEGGPSSGRRKILTST